MSISYSSVVKAPIDEVFAWHTRPGALTRLAPPWQPVRVGQEAASLRDGRAVLLLPGGVRWVAEHQPDGYDPPRQFVDQLAAGGLSSTALSRVLTWRHVHGFHDAGQGTTRVEDDLQTTVPEAALRQMFGYRHRQLAADLQIQQWARARQPEPLTVAVTGSSGLIGTALTALLTTGGHRVIKLVRHPASGENERQWNPDRPAPDLLDGVDALIHLAGAAIAGRFTERHKREVRDSRIGPTRALAELAASTARHGGGLKAFLSASAIGYYGAGRGDEVLTEVSTPGSDFLADVATGWEAATRPAADAGLRTVLMRTGLVLSPRGGTLRALFPLFEAGLGGKIGDGRQWMSWIGIDDLTDSYLRALVDPALSGPVNAVAPDPVRNADFTKILARVLRRPAVIPVPGFGPRLVFGEEGARELAEASQRVRPDALLAAGHAFRYTRLEPALRHLLGHVTGA